MAGRNLQNDVMLNTTNQRVRLLLITAVRLKDAPAINFDDELIKFRVLVNHVGNTSCKTYMKRRDLAGTSCYQSHIVPGRWLYYILCTIKRFSILYSLL